MSRLCQWDRLEGDPCPHGYRALRIEVVKDDCVPPMRRADIEKLANSIRALLTDPDADIKEPLRRRYEGALAALEAVLGQRSSLVDNFEADLL